MAVLNIDPPPETNDVSELGAYVGNLYYTLLNVLTNIDEENLSEEFLNKLNGGGG